MAYVESFRDLEVYKLSRELSSSVYEITKRFPNEEKFSLTDQIRRSSRSVGAQIAEAWAKRRYEKHFVSKLTDADGEQQETQHWIETAYDCGYVTKVKMERFIADLCAVGRMLESVMQKSHAFCGKDNLLVREDSATYFSAYD